jgi:hypothetical protein
MRNNRRNSLGKRDTFLFGNGFRVMVEQEQISV